VTPEPRRIRVLEDDAVVRESLAALLETAGFMPETFGDPEAFLAAQERGRAACIVLDLRLPRVGGMDVLDRLRAKDAATPVIMISGHADVDHAVQALHRGAQDFLEKPFDGEELVRRVERLARAAGAPSGEADPFAALTPRERDVMVEVVAGHSNKVIGRRLGLSPKTVEIHRARVMEKAGARNLSHLVRMALKAGIDPDADAARG